jgi:hypothetical protein
MLFSTMHPDMPCDTEEQARTPSTDFDRKDDAPHPSLLDPTNPETVNFNGTSTRAIAEIAANAKPTKTYRAGPNHPHRSCRYRRTPLPHRIKANASVFPFAFDGVTAACKRCGVSGPHPCQ